jgi:predicted esterase
MAGCAVPQKRGDGRLERIIEPTTKRDYWLYLPKGYVEADEATRRSRTWPTVVTFHGMRPFDGGAAQAMEWEYEADRYGFVVVSPELRAPNIWAQFPVRSVHPDFKRDEEATLAILDHVFANTHADPNNVLSTSWSSGGYMAHYMLNKYPDRFTALGVRQSNFSSEIVDAGAARRSIYHPILIINTQNDFKICKDESREAVNWYERHGFRSVAWVYIKGLGHERTPDLAADFFGRVAGVEPSRPNEVLVKRQAIDGNAEGLAFLSGKYNPYQSRQAQPRQLRGDDTALRMAGDGALRRGAGDANRRAPSESQARAPVNIRVSSVIDVQPLHLGFWAVVPSAWYDLAEFRWSLNGELIAKGINGQKVLSTPGEHTLELEVVLPDRQRHAVSRTVRVLPQLQSAESDAPQADAALSRNR